MTPLTIDPNYVHGLCVDPPVRLPRGQDLQDNAAFGVAAENPQLLYTASLAGNTPYAVLGSAGANGGNYNATISACSPSTSIVNYTNQVETTSAGNTVDVAVPVYKTVNSCANVTNLLQPGARLPRQGSRFDPGWGHFEVFGIAGLRARDRLSRRNHQQQPLWRPDRRRPRRRRHRAAARRSPRPATTTTASCSAASAQLPRSRHSQHLTFGAKGLYGPGVGRYGDSTLADVTPASAGALKPIHNVSGLLTVEATPTPR
jgi:hypothetical protein